MNLPDKSSYFTRVEDKYVFRVSTAFWHLLIGILTLAAIIGIVAFLWSVIPPSKSEVKAATYPAKQDYPLVKKVSLADLHLKDEKLPPPVEKNQKGTEVQISKPKPIEKIDIDPSKPAYELALIEFRKMIPDDQWKPGTYLITNPTGWEMYHLEQYRIWQPSGPSVEEDLDNIYDVVKASDFAHKKNVLETISKIIKSVPSDSKGKSVQKIASSINQNWIEPKILDSVCNLIVSTLPTFKGKSASEAAIEIIGFSLANRGVVFEFLPFAAKTCSILPDSLRATFFSGLTSAYDNNFNENFPVQKEATDQFKSLIPQLNGVNPTKALKKFYTVYNYSNRQRNLDIARLESEYKIQVNKIEADSLAQVRINEIIYQEEKQKKSDLKWKALQAVAGGFVLIALLGTVLTLLSIQRILKKIEETRS